MLTERQRAHYEAFGFLFLRELFSPDEMSAIGEEADRIWEEESRKPDFRRSDEGSQHTSPFVEISSTLSSIVEDDRIYLTAQRLVGEGMVWTNSEGNITGYGTAPWHPDRRNMAQGDLDYPRLKVMLYLDEVSAENGALRVIPGSHKNPYHDSLYPMLQKQDNGMDWDVIPEADDPGDMPYGVAGDRMPCHVVESKPGRRALLQPMPVARGVQRLCRPPLHRSEVRRQADDGWAHFNAALVQRRCFLAARGLPE